MTYVINEPCIATKDASCVFGEADQLYIDPEECIDCDACVEVCPVDAITAEDSVPPEWEDYIERNAAYYRRAQAQARNGPPVPPDRRCRPGLRADLLNGGFQGRGDGHASVGARGRLGVGVFAVPSNMRTLSRNPRRPGVLRKTGL